MNPKKIVEEIKRRESFLISAHMNLEGDAIGSLLAMKSLLDKLGKKNEIVVPEEPPELYSKIRGIEAVRAEIPRDFKFDTLMALDCTSIKRLGKLGAYAEDNKAFSINIDHHISNTHFGDINWVEPEASSTGEMLYGLFEEAELNIDKDAAEYLYIAMMTDTGSFRYTNTTPRALRMAADLVEKGADPADSFDSVYSNRTLDNIRLLSRALDNIKVDASGKIAWAALELSLLERSHYKKGDLEGFIEFPRSIKDVEVAILFTETAEGVVKISLRSNTYFDVNKLASVFGGGGHKKASGCTIKGPLDGVVERVIEETKRQL